MMLHKLYSLCSIEAEWGGELALNGEIDGDLDSWLVLRHYPHIRLGSLKKTTKSLIIAGYPREIQTK
jgi:hypothetical protein